MKLLPVRHLWGVNEPWESSFPRFRAFGYAGIECGVPPAAERGRFQDQLQGNGFFWVAQQWTGGRGLEGHLDSFKRQVEEGLKCAPRFINSHSGRDGWEEAEAAAFFEKVLRYTEGLKVPLCHETHRGRVLFNPWVTARMLKRFPSLQLACDFSHFVCVSEGFLAEDEDAMRLCAEHALHIHARVGHPEGPQVSDPRAPEFKEALERHETWWDWIWDSQARRGLKESTLCPEFGPAGYLPTLPYTRVPVADQAEICEWMAKRQLERFSKR